MPKYSIIIPAHNSAAYIQNALKSVRKQTVEDYELIVVCDACSDNTAEVAAKYNPDKLIKTNYHLCGPARNAGLDVATGEWVLFMDDDDRWVDGLVIKTIDESLSDNIDILYFAFHFGILGPTFQHPLREYVAVWNKCWRRSFIGNTRFPAVQYAEDEAFHRAMMEKNPRKRYITDLLYQYQYPRVGSILYNHDHGREYPE